MQNRLFLIFIPVIVILAGTILYLLNLQAKIQNQPINTGLPANLNEVLNSGNGYLVTTTIDDVKTYAGNEIVLEGFAKKEAFPIVFYLEHPQYKPTRFDIKTLIYKENSANNNISKFSHRLNLPVGYNFDYVSAVVETTSGQVIKRLVYKLNRPEIVNRIKLTNLVDGAKLKAGATNEIKGSISYLGGSWVYDLSDKNKNIITSGVLTGKAGANNSIFSDFVISVKLPVQFDNYSDLVLTLGNVDGTKMTINMYGVGESAFP